MKEYKKPIVNTISIKTSGILSGSYAYNCPIRPWVKCDEYNADMQEWKAAVEYAAVHKLNHPFMFMCDDRMSCPRKTCSIFLEWQRQQKTK